VLGDIIIIVLLKDTYLTLFPTLVDRGLETFCVRSYITPYAVRVVTHRIICPHSLFH